MAATSSDWGEYGEYAEYLVRLNGDNAADRGRLIAGLNAAIRQELTPRQRQLIKLYYSENKSMSDIAREQGVCVSTVSRTLDRARNRLRRCLKYGARQFIVDDP